MELSVFSFKVTIPKSVITSNELFVTRNGSLIAKQKKTSILKPKKTCGIENQISKKNKYICGLIDTKFELPSPCDDTVDEWSKKF